MRRRQQALSGYAAVGAGAPITLRTEMPAGKAIRNRSETVTVVMLRGGVEVLRQEMRGLRRGTPWTWFWLARRKGSSGWNEASTAREAIRKAMLLPPRKLPGWMNEAAACCSARWVDRSGMPLFSEPEAMVAC